MIQRTNLRPKPQRPRWSGGGDRREQLSRVKGGPSSRLHDCWESFEILYPCTKPRPPSSLGFPPGSISIFYTGRGDILETKGPPVSVTFPDPYLG